MLVGEQKLLFPPFFFFFKKKLDFSELAWNLRQDTLWALLPHCVMGKGKGEKCIFKREARTSP